MMTQIKYICLTILNLIFIFLMSCEKEMPSESISKEPIVSIHYLPESIDRFSSENILFMAKVNDPQGLSNIKQVHIEIFQQNQIINAGMMWDDGQNGDIISQNGTFTYALVPNQFSFSLGAMVVNFFAEDLDGNKSLELKDTLDVEENVPNEPPQIDEVNGPITISRSQGGLHLLTATVSDPQGLSDIQKVILNSFLPDSSPSSGNPFNMYDTGANGDAVARDGMYSFQFTISPSNALGNYRFEVQAQDKSGAKSDIVVHVITVVQ